MEGYSRKMAKTVSVMLPSRERAELAQSSIKSLGKVHEVLLAVDDDDPQLEDYKKIKGVKLLIEPRHGYRGLNEYYNKMCLESTGDWVLLWNDDAVMHTPNWQEYIQDVDHTVPAVINIHFENNNWFPLVSRPFFETLGWFSRSPANDSYVKEIAEQLGIHHDRFENIQIEHLRETLDDETAKNSKEIAIETGGTHASTRNKEMKEDIATLRGVL